MQKLSVTLITLNEEENIAKCLESVKNLADEVIVVDCGSTDKTIDIAKKYKTKVYTRVFDNFATQKNYAASKASGDWIFSIDADEEVTPGLALEIRQALGNTEFDGYLVPRRNFILGGEIKYTRWSPDTHVWLWKKTKGKWKGIVHEEVEVNGTVGILKNAKLHYQDKTVSEFIQTNNKYSQLEALKLFGLGMKFSLVGLFWDPIYEFFLRYIYKRGFLDGWRGFVLSYLMAFYKLSVWVKVWEKENK